MFLFYYSKLNSVVNSRREDLPSECRTLFRGSFTGNIQEEAVLQLLKFFDWKYVALVFPIDGVSQVLISFSIPLTRKIEFSSFSFVVQEARHYFDVLREHNITILSSSFYPINSKSFTLRVNVSISASKYNPHIFSQKPHFARYVVCTLDFRKMHESLFQGAMETILIFAQ